jgi:uncharacterized protein YkwD
LYITQYSSFSFYKPLKPARNIQVFYPDQWTSCLSVSCRPVSLVIAMTLYRKGIAILVPILLMLASTQAMGSHVLSSGHSGKSNHTLKSDSDATSDEKAGKPDYMTVTELEVIMEINLLRSDPAGYARTYLEPFRKYYHGKLLRLPGRNPIATKEGIAALDECILELENSSPTPVLSPCKGLAQAARDLADDQGSTETTGHTGNDGSDMSTRIERYGRWDGSVAENISYGFNEARHIVIALLIDDNVPSRGHRKNLLDNSFNLVGVTIGPHQRYRAMCVMDFAAEYTTKRI